jgi:hypothetical protein
MLIYSTTSRVRVLKVKAEYRLWVFKLVFYLIMYLFKEIGGGGGLRTTLR